MFSGSRFKRRLIVGVAVAVVAANSIVLYASLGSIVDAAGWVRHSLDVKRELAVIAAEMAKAESGQRGYLLTGDIRYLDPHHRASSIIESRLEALAHLVSDNPTQAEHITRLAELVEQKFDEMSETIVRHNAGDREQAIELVRQNRGQAIAVEMREVVDRMETVEADLLSSRRETAELAHKAAASSLLAFIFATILLLGLIYYLAKAEITRRAQASRELSDLANQLHGQTESLTRERNEVALLNEASNFLQSCDTMEEIASLAGPFLQKLFVGCDGAVHLTASSRNRLDRLCFWGTAEFPPYFAPHQCWSLRRGQAHLHSQDNVAPACDHIHGPGDAPNHLCLPLVAQGETLGVLTLVAPASSQAEIGELQRLGEMVVRQLGLTVANIRLRESLKEQTIRDPMTNMFNRRYLDVAAQKEIARAKRFGRSVTVAMIDIDHFKRFNDTHGHQAGDAAIIAVSHYIQANIRDSDWLFRYGGEEFLLMLTDTEGEEALARLNELRVGVSKLSIMQDGIELPQVTLSCGVACHPQHGEDIDELVAIADEALYAAKQAGRNRVVLADTRSVTQAA